MSTLSVAEYGVFLKVHQLEHQILAMDYQAISAVLEQDRIFEDPSLAALYPELYCLDFVLAWAFVFNAACQRNIDGLILKQQQMPPNGFVALCDYVIFLEDQRNAHLFLAQREAEVKALLLTIKARVEQKPWLEIPIFLSAIELIRNARLEPHHQKILGSLTQTQQALEQFSNHHSKNITLTWSDLKDYLNSRTGRSSLKTFFDQVHQAYPSLHPLLQSWLDSYPYPFPVFKKGNTK